MLPDEEAEEIMLRAHFYGIRSSGGLCMAAVKKMVAFAKERGLRAVAKVLESAYVDDCNSSVTTLEELEEIKKRNARLHERTWVSDQGSYMDRRKCTRRAHG